MKQFGKKKFMPFCVKNDESCEAFLCPEDGVARNVCLISDCHLFMDKKVCVSMCLIAMDFWGLHSASDVNPSTWSTALRNADGHELDGTSDSHAVHAVTWSSL